MHVFEGHTRSCTALCNLDTPGLFLSAGIDYTFRIWSIDNFQQVYCFKLPLTEVLTNVFLQKDRFILILGRQICIGAMNLIGRCMGIVKSRVERMLCTDTQIIALNKDNSCIAFNEDGSIKSTIYPPPTAKNVKELHYHNELIYLLLSSGTICVFNFSAETALLHKIVRK